MNGKMQEKEIVDKIVGKFDYSMNLRFNKNIVREIIAEGIKQGKEMVVKCELVSHDILIKQGKEIGKKNALSEIQELHDNMAEEIAKAKVESRKEFIEDILDMSCHDAPNVCQCCQDLIKKFQKE